ncbi:hypothetical protein LAZ67_15002352 [Cordylochernes scorpioides]|uniref:histone deacetylase n=1 Tax=Cordylochernes scorpioides TaxID=51811 RepID=A0ABY6L9I7_9ARAC|nr:hypothetical protein LAZ67_15002352 [Cordylochernes scorpioides]
MLEMVEENPNWKEKVITGDETWVYGYEPETKRQSMEWKGKDEPRTKKSRLCKSKNKVLLVTFFDIKGIMHCEYLEEGQTINKESYLNIMRRVRESIRLKRSEIEMAWSTRKRRQKYQPPAKRCRKIQEEEDKSTEHNRTFYFWLPPDREYSMGLDHPMAPFRMTLTDDLVMLYDLFSHMKVFEALPTTFDKLATYHTPEYINHLQTVPVGYKGTEFGFGHDCPSFIDLQDFVMSSANAAIQGANLLRTGYADTIINWHGGYHHAMPDRASGFCYVNDVVLSIQELLKTYQRVLYIDIDHHHGDGVEHAFKSSNRVFTLSLHKYDGVFFPRTGSLAECGEGSGRGYSLNLPLKDNINDENYCYIYKAAVSRVAEFFCPEAIVLQSGADSLAHDYLGSFNLTEKGYVNCQKTVKNLGLPYILTGGGGYTIYNVARCWAYQTAEAVGEADSVPRNIPLHNYYHYYAPSFMSEIMAKDVKDQNNRLYLDSLIQTTHERMRELEAAPSVGLGQYM